MLALLGNIAGRLLIKSRQTDLIELTEAKVSCRLVWTAFLKSTLSSHQTCLNLT
jgi:hypothetical protein